MPGDESGGEGQQSPGEVDAAGRTRAQAATEARWLRLVHFRDTSQRIAVAAMPGDKRLSAAFALSGCELQSEPQCEVQCEAR